MPRTMCFCGHDRHRPGLITGSRAVSGRSGTAREGDLAMTEPRGYRGRVPLESGTSGMLGPA